MELKDRHWTYRKGKGTVHISRTGNFMTLCCLKMDAKNEAFESLAAPECPVCIKDYKDRTGHDPLAREIQTSLF